MALSEQQLDYVKQAADKAARGRPFADYGLNREERKEYRKILENYKDYRDYSKALEQSKRSEVIQQQVKADQTMSYANMSPASNFELEKPERLAELRLRYQESVNNPQRLDEVRRRAAIQSDNYTNPKTGRPFGVVTRAPSTYEQYRNAIRNRNPVTSTVSFTLTQIRDRLAKAEGYNSGQQFFGGQTGKKVQQLGEFALYANPVTGPALGASAGVAQIATSGGRAEAKEIAKELKESYGIPAIATEGGIYVLAGAGALTGVKGLVSQIERARGLPTFETRFIGNNQIFQQTDDTTKSFLESRAITTQRGLLGDRTFISGSQTRTIFNPTSQDDILGFKSATRGASREVARDLLTGRPKFSRPRAFGSADLGDARQLDNLPLRIMPGVSRDLDNGFVVRSISASGFKGETPSRFISMAGGGKVEDNLFFVAGKSIPLNERGLPTNKNIARSVGLITNKDSEEPIRLISSSNNQVTKLINKNVVQKQLAKTAIENSLRSQSNLNQGRNIIFARGTSNIFPALSILPRESVQPQIVSGIKGSKSLFTGNVIYERTEDLQSSNPNFKSNANSNQLTNTIYILKRPQKIPSRSKEIIIPAQPVALLTGEDNSLRQPVKNIDLLESSQKSRQRYRFDSRSRTPETTKSSNKIIPLSKTNQIGNNKVSYKKILGDIFEASGRVRGEDVSLGTFKTKFLAEKRLKGFLKETLGASGTIKKGGRALSFGELSSFRSREFRAAKRNNFRVVQSRGFRLGTRSEVGLIQSSKKSSKRGKLKWFS